MSQDISETQAKAFLLALTQENAPPTEALAKQSLVEVEAVEENNDDDDDDDDDSDDDIPIKKVVKRRTSSRCALSWTLTLLYMLMQL